VSAGVLVAGLLSSPVSLRVAFPSSDQKTGSTIALASYVSLFFYLNSSFQEMTGEPMQFGSQIRMSLGASDANLTAWAMLP
jgi:hypothetical protein